MISIGAPRRLAKLSELVRRTTINFFFPKENK